MIIIIDLDLQQAVQGFGSKQPAPAITVKNQDTPTLSIYFAKGNVNYDLGASPGIRFGLFGTGPNALVSYSTFNRLLDAQSRVTYVGYPNFNTAQMLAALGTQASINCLGEIRYQTSFGTIARTLDIDFIVQRSLLSETVLDTTTAAFTVPAVNSNVTIAINSTAWLSVGLNLAIGAGAGAYQVVSITDGTHFVAKNQGGAGNAAPATVIPSGTTVGIAATNVIQTYPDASLLELITRKNTANGYAGLNGVSKLNPSAIPVDNSSIGLSSAGNLQVGYLIDSVGANFTTPASGATVNITVTASNRFTVEDWIFIPIAGYYEVTAIVDTTHITIENLGDVWNAAAGATITTGAAILPQTSIGGTGGGGPGQNAFSTTSANFTVPAALATVSVTMASTAWLGGAGYTVFIAGAGYYAVSSITNATQAVLTNLGYVPTNSAPGTVINSGAMVTPGGIAGPSSTGTPGANAYDATTASFTVPAILTSVPVAIGNTAWLTVGQVVVIAGAGSYQVAGITSATVFSATNLNYSGNATAGTVIAGGAHVSPGGFIGPAGAGGAGLNAFTTLSAGFTQPAASATVSINVGTTAWMVVGQAIFILGGGYYTVSSVTDITHAVISNLGYTGNAAPGATVASGGGVVPSGLNGQPGVNAFTITSAAFTMPTIGSTVTVTVGVTGWMAQGQNVFIPGAGYFSVSIITDATHAVLTNSGTTGNAAAGTVINSGAQVSPAGSIGPTGAIGPQGPAGNGGGGVDMQDPENGIEWTDHFITPTGLGGVGNLNLTLPWTLASQGTVGSAQVAASFVTSGPELSAIGIYTQSVTAIADLTMGYIANAYNLVIPIGLGVCTWKCKVTIDALLTAAEAAIDYIGIFRYNIAQGFYGGFYFKYNYALSANWRCVVRTGTGPDTGANVTDVDSGIAVAATTWVKLKVVTNAAWTSFAFYINNALVATIVTNAPTSAADIGVAPHFLQIRSAYTSTARWIYPGYFYLSYPFTN
jgi:hypothetical protein